MNDKDITTENTKSTKKESVRDEILQITTEEYKKNPYRDFLKIVDNTELFNRKHKGINFRFEVHAYIGTNQEIKVMVECGPRLILGILLGKACYFSINPDGSINDLDGCEF